MAASGVEAVLWVALALALLNLEVALGRIVPRVVDRAVA